MVRALIAVLGLAALAAAQDPAPAGTTVSAHLLTGHVPGRNLVWCSTFQLAWNALGEDLCGEPLRLQDSPTIERVLNGSGIGKQDLDPESVYVKAARVAPGLIDEINAALKKQFGDQAPPPLPASEGAGGALAYAFLGKTLAFAKPFDRQQDPLSWRDTSPVQAFGIGKVDGRTPKDLCAQVQILNDRRGAYILELRTTSPKDRLILAQTEPKATLKETLDEVRERVRAAPAPVAIQVTDQFLVPCVQVAVDRVYTEIVGRTVLNKKLENQTIAQARQTIRFALDEKGAAVKSEAVLLTKNGHAPRKIVFDRPFLLYLERTGAEHPYLAIWFENPELFVKAGAADKK